ncbi:hypothetical protein [Mariniphaga anaerophila]|nr:hypothetical protein [Mariniphaga anaerophila]
MPYRRLPTTDKARLRAMDAALNATEDRDSGKLAFSKSQLFDLKNIKSNFENHLKQYEFDLKTESEKSGQYKFAFEKARLYVSHFIQVLYMNIEREELKEDVLSYYGLSDLDGKIPLLNAEQEVLEWGNRIIDGEQKRMQRGGSPIYNPSIALVKVKVEDFREAAIFQQNLKRNTLRSYEKMQQLRKTTNDFISQLWTEIEENVGDGSPEQKRQRAQEYGLVYVFRRNEKKKLRAQGMQVDLLFEFS